VIKIENLIAKLCPDGMPFTSLELIASVITGDQLNKELLSQSGKYPVMNGGISPSGFYHEFNNEAETTVISQGGASAGFVTWMDTKFWAGAHLFVIKPKQNFINARFLYYFLKAREINIQAMKTGAGIPSLNRSKLIEIKVPVPPMEIQYEIVKILDTFSELESSLKTELDARKKQFDFFRDRFVSELKSNCDWIPFGSLATIVRGASPRPIEKYLSEDVDAVPWIKIGDTDINERYIIQTAQRISVEGVKKSRKIEPGDFILSNSMSFGRPYISKIQGCIHDGWLAISNFQEHLVSDFLYYILQSKHIQNEFNQKSNSGSVSNLNAEIVKSVLIPVPKIDRQLAIVSMLGAMEDLVISQTTGLPAEIFARRKQFEYYRDRLLTFKELESA